MNTIKNKIIENYPLTERLNCDLCCYSIDSKRYLVFSDEIIDKNGIENILNITQEKVNNATNDGWKTIIVVGYTEDTFKKKELVFFDGVNTIVVFYLINKETKKIYMDASWISFIGYDYKKVVRTIDKIVRQEYTDFS